MMSDRANEMVACRDINGAFEDVPVIELQFRPSVYGVIVQEGKVLLSKMWDGYDFPGGGIHKGERISDALVREVKEETGLMVQPGTLLHASDDFFISIESRKKLHSVLLFYTCEVVGGEISTDSFSEQEKKYMQPAQWIPIESVDSLKFYNPVDSPSLIRRAAAL